MKLPHQILRLLLTARAQRWTLVFGAIAFASTLVRAETAANGASHLSDALNLPLHFEANPDPGGGERWFVARGRGCNFFVAPTEAMLLLVKYDLPAASSRSEWAKAVRNQVAQTRTLHFSFLGANPRARLGGWGELDGKANYLLGNDPARWRTGVPLFARVRVENIYPGVDLIYYGNDRRLEYDFIIGPKIDPSVIALQVTGADKLHLNERGDLVFTLRGDEILQPKPRIFQTVAGTQREVSGGYRLTGQQKVTFQVGEYDRELPLVIDPVLGYSTFFGDSGSDIGWDIAVDKAGTNGFIYVAGQTTSANLPVTTTNTFGGGNSAGDVFVAKFDHTGTAISYLTYMGGNAQDGALAVAVDPQGNACITGFTTSTNFPTPNGLRTKLTGTAYPGLGVYEEEAFVAKLNPTGLPLFSTYLGGSSTDLGVSVAVDGTGYVYVSGTTDSTDFYTTNALYLNLAGQDDVFVAKLNSNGTAFVYSTYLGGTKDDHGDGIAADAAGFAYVTGYTLSTNYPITPNAPQRYLNNPVANATNHILGARDVFITKIQPDGGELALSTFLGGSRDDKGFRLTLDEETNVFITGSALSLNFPTYPASNTNAPRGLTTANALPDVFVSKLSAAGTNWVYSMVFGGAGKDEGWDVAVDSHGQAHIVGESYSVNFPTTNTSGFLRATNSGGADVFITVVGSNGTSLVRSAYLGGGGGDFGYGIETDNASNDYLVGQTSSANFPTVAPFQPTSGGGKDAFIAKVVVEPVLFEALAGENVVLYWETFAPEFVLQSNTNVASRDGWVNVATLPVLVDGLHTVTLGATNHSLFFRLLRP